jgi:hypothetical protein
MGGSGSGRPDDGAGSVPHVPGEPSSEPSSEGGRRLRAAEVVATKLGELLEDILDDVRSLPRWRPAPFKRREMERVIVIGLDFYHAWQEAFGDAA